MLSALRLYIDVRPSLEGVMGRERAVAAEGVLVRLPIYRQLQHIFLGLITSGVWPRNQALPSETNLAAQYGVSVGTIRKVVDELEDRGFVKRHQGRGTFVNDPEDRVAYAIFDPIRNADASFVEWDPLKVEVEHGPATLEERRLLGRDTEVLRLSWLRTTSSRVLGFQRTAIPSDIKIDLARARHLQGLAELYARAGVVVERSEEALRTSLPARSTAIKMGVGPDTTLHVAECRYYDDHGLVVGACELWLKLDGQYIACSRSVRDVLPHGA